MPGKSDNIDEDIFEDTNEDANDSEKTEGEDTEDDTSDDTPPAKDSAEEDLESSTYRPSDGEKEEKGEKSKETVPLDKYLKVKKELKRLQSEQDSPLNNQALEEFAEESGLKLEVVKNLAKIITSQATAEATRVAEERVKPIVLEKMSRTNLEAFEKDFNKSIVAKYPELASKIDIFKKVAFSKEFLHLKNLEEIKNEFFPDVKAPSKEVKKETPEGGSIGGNKENEKVDFAKLKDNPEQYEKVLKDPVAREAYYSWLNSNV
jgi:hypothetical protein